MATPSCVRRSADFAALAKLGEHDFDALLVDDAQSRGRYAKAHPALLLFEPEAAPLQVGQEAALGLVVGVGNMMPRLRLLSGDLADSGHESGLRWRKPAIIRALAP